MGKGDVLGHEPMGIVEEVGPEVGSLAVGDRVVIPFQICCGSCWMCDQGLFTQCETTQVRDQGMGAALFGFSKLYGEVPGGQAEYLRVPQAQFMPIKVPEGPPRRALPLPLRRAADGVAVGRLRGRAEGRHPARPRTGAHRRHGQPDRGATADCASSASTACPSGSRVSPRAVPRSSTCPRWTTSARRSAPAPRGRGADAVVDAVGMEAHGSPVAEAGQRLFNVLPKRLTAPLMSKVGLDRMAAIYTAIDAVRRGGTISLIGVYGGQTDPMPMLTLFDKQIQLRMGQANVKRWVDDIMPLLVDDADPLGTEDFATHRMPLDEAPAAYENFQKKQDGTIKVVFSPH